MDLSAHTLGAEAFTFPRNHIIGGESKWTPTDMVGAASSQFWSYDLLILTEKHTAGEYESHSYVYG